MDKHEIPYSDRQFRSIIQDCESLPENEQIPFLYERMEEVRKSDLLPSKERTYLLKKYLNEIEIKKRIFNSKGSSNTSQKSKSIGLDNKSKVQKIRWMKDDMYLIALFELLCRSDYLHPDVHKRIPSIICEHFSDKNNDNFINKNIRSQKNRLLQDAEKIDDVIHEIRDSFREISKILVDEATA